MKTHIARYVALTLLALIFTLPASAQDERNRLENWYTDWGLGYANVMYPSPLDDVFDALKDLPGVSHASLYLDLLGFYWPMGEQTILGVKVNAWGDAYAVADEDLTVVGVTYGASLMHFLTNRIGDGVFIRGDIGPARIAVSGTGLGSDEFSEWGFGFLAGGGYGFPVSRETRILIHVHYAMRQVEGDGYGNLGIGISGLF